MLFSHVSGPRSINSGSQFRRANYFTIFNMQTMGIPDRLNMHHLLGQRRISSALRTLRGKFCSFDHVTGDIKLIEAAVSSPVLPRPWDSRNNDVTIAGRKNIEVAKAVADSCLHPALRCSY